MPAAPYPQNPPVQTGFAMQQSLVPAPERALAAPEVSEAVTDALRDARSRSTQRIYASHVRAFGAWLDAEVLDATPVDVANYLAGPGTARSHSWRSQAAAAIKSAFEEAGQQAPTTHVAYLTRATVQALTPLWSPHHVPDMPLFGLGGRAIAERIRAAARAAGLIDGYSGHSGRTGAAHSLAAHGASLVELQQAGRWKSPSMPAAYARSARAGHGAVARLLERQD